MRRCNCRIASNIHADNAYSLRDVIKKRNNYSSGLAQKRQTPQMIVTFEKWCTIDENNDKVATAILSKQKGKKQ